MLRTVHQATLGRQGASGERSQEPDQHAGQEARVMRGCYRAVGHAHFALAMNR